MAGPRNIPSPNLAPGPHAPCGVSFGSRRKGRSAADRSAAARGTFRYDHARGRITADASQLAGANPRRGQHGRVAGIRQALRAGRLWLRPQARPAGRRCGRSDAGRAAFRLDGDWPARTTTAIKARFAAGCSRSRGTRSSTFLPPAAFGRAARAIRRPIGCSIRSPAESDGEDAWELEYQRRLASLGDGSHQGGVSREHLASLLAHGGRGRGGGRGRQAASACRPARSTSPRAACWPDSRKKSRRSGSRRKANMNIKAACLSSDELRQLLSGSADRAASSGRSTWTSAQCCQAKLEELATGGTNLSQLVERAARVRAGGHQRLLAGDSLRWPVQPACRRIIAGRRRSRHYANAYETPPAFCSRRATRPTWAGWRTST